MNGRNEYKIKIETRQRKTFSMKKMFAPLGDAAHTLEAVIMNTTIMIIFI